VKERSACRGLTGTHSSGGAGRPRSGIVCAVRLALTHLRHAKTGGTERYLDRLAEFLARRGHAVTVVCRSHAAPPHPGVRFEVLHGLALGGAWRVWSFARAVERHVTTRAGAQPPYDLVVGLGRTWSQDVLRLGGGCQRTYLELAHAATLTPRARLLGGGAWKHALAVRIEERALRVPDVHVITNSDMVRRDVEARHGVPAERVTTIHNGVDLARFRPELRASVGAAKRRELGLGADELVVLFLGTGYARKGLDLALEAFALLAAERADARLVVAGFDSARASFEARAQELGIAGRTCFVGGTLAPEALYAAADLYVLPTRYDPFANSTLEALASGLPVITSTTNGAAELLTEAEGACVDVAQGVEPLRAALATWSASARRRAGAVAARALAERHGDEDKFRQAEALFERLAGRRDAARTAMVER
jgi:UDP-glucose:(heptosyl)LPS alpha-1,3-glucosyltransferase